MPNGNVYPCCIYDLSKPIGNLKENTLEEIANSESLKKIRSDMLQNKIVDGCKRCNNLSDNNSEDNRTQFNNLFAKYIKDAKENTEADGNILEFKLRYMNIRYSNLCNLSCRTCGPDHSSMIAQEQRKKQPVIKIIDKIPNYMEEIFKYLPYADAINFAGGESLLISEHWQVLDELIKVNNTDVKINYVTNLSKLSHNNKNLLEYIKKFSNFSLKVSIDGIAERGEIYRNGSIWKNIEKNLRELKNNNVIVKIICTIGAMNVWHSVDVEKYLIENSLIDKDKFFLNLITNSNLDITILPEKFKEEIVLKINSHQEWLKEHNIDHEKWNNVINFMLAENNSLNYKQFLKYNKFIDKIRKQKIFETFTEFENYI